MVRYFGSTFLFSFSVKHGPWLENIPYASLGNVEFHENGYTFAMGLFSAFPLLANSADNKTASVAQLDVCPTGDQEVVGLTFTYSATFFCGDLIMKYFPRSFSPFCCLRLNISEIFLKGL